MSEFLSYSPETSREQAEARLARVFEAVGCRTQVELASFFDIRQSSIADAKRRGRIPSDWLVKLLLRKSIHPAWILTGEGPRLLQPVDAEGNAAPPPVCPAKVQPLRESSLEELVAEVARRVLPKT